MEEMVAILEQKVVDLEDKVVYLESTLAKAIRAIGEIVKMDRENSRYMWQVIKELRGVK